MVASIQIFGTVTSRLSIFRAFLSANRRYTTMSETLNKVSDVDIEGHGRFKYILINVQDENTKATKPIVRGYAKCPYHADIFIYFASLPECFSYYELIDLADIFEETCKQLEQYSSLKPECVGGGRIEHDPDAKTIKVYGYSQGFGKADHEVSVGLLKKKYVDYNITCSDEGY